MAATDDQCDSAPPEVDPEVLLPTSWALEEFLEEDFEEEGSGDEAETVLDPCLVLNQIRTSYLAPLEAPCAPLSSWATVASKSQPAVVQPVEAQPEEPRPDGDFVMPVPLRPEQVFPLEEEGDEKKDAEFEDKETPTEEEEHTGTDNPEEEWTFVTRKSRKAKGSTSCDSSKARKKEDRYGQMQERA